MAMLRAFLLPAIFAALLHSRGDPACNNTLREGELRRILEYGERQAGLNKGALRLFSQENVADTCYQRILLATVTGESRSSLTLFLSPDHGFLTSDLMDLRLDPGSADRLSDDRINRMLTASPSPQLGNSDAPVTLVVFVDLECAYCRSLQSMLREKVLPAESGTLRIQERQFPLLSHPHAEAAARTAACSFQQGDAVYWAVSNFLFEHQSTIGDYLGTGSRYPLSSKVPALKPDAYNACLTNQVGAEKVQEDVELGLKVGTRVTPTLYLNGKRIEGVMDSVELRYRIEQEANSLATRHPNTNDERLQR
jgi:protein-disulfide isomerase